MLTKRQQEKMRDVAIYTAYLLTVAFGCLLVAICAFRVLLVVAGFFLPVPAQMLVFCFWVFCISLGGVVLGLATMGGSVLHYVFRR